MTFVDSNVFIHAILKIKEKATTSTTHITEIVYTLIEVEAHSE